MQQVTGYTAVAAGGIRPARARWLLVVGMAAGVLCAAIGMLAVTASSSLPAQAVATVNQRPILRDAWLRAVAAVASERSQPLTQADERRILDRLIDEELLVQHGIALGLAERDPRLRSEIVSEVMLAAGSAAAQEPGEDALRAYYKDHVDEFTLPGRLRVQAWTLGADGTRADFMPPLPTDLLAPAKLQTYLGPALTASALNLPLDRDSEPIVSDSSRVVLRVLERQAGAAPAFEQVHDQVRAEMKRRADEAAVRSLIADLRRNTKLVIQADLP